MHTTDPSALHSFAEKEIADLLRRVDEGMPNGLDDMALVLGAMIGRLFQMLQDDDEGATAKIVADINQVFERMGIGYRLRSID